MGTTTSQPVRTLAKEITSSSVKPITRSTSINQLPPQKTDTQAKPQANNDNVEGKEEDKEPQSFYHSETKPILKRSDNFRKTSSIGTKDGEDPDFASKAMKLGMVNIKETQQKLNRNNIAVKSLEQRAKLYAQGQEELETQHDKKTLHPSTIRTLIDDLKFYDRERIIKDYKISEAFLDDLGTRLSIARTKFVPPKSSEEKNDEENERVYTASGSKPKKVASSSREFT